jgi:hypothetical protein
MVTGRFGSAVGVHNLVASTTKYIRACQHNGPATPWASICAERPQSCCAECCIPAKLQSASRWVSVAHLSYSYGGPWQIPSFPCHITTPPPLPTSPPPPSANSHPCCTACACTCFFVCCSDAEGELKLWDLDSQRPTASIRCDTHYPADA